ncbi:hypothetical protein ACRHK7_02965 [Weissella tructae]|uniref:Uncharacterized protein n=2 Tax=Weissella TaxID=46255 RepID=A0A088GMG9_9LACO|nr:MULTISPECIES: hypothetical protein [Weissella]AIM63505.1 hypothetical protein WS74_1256 [Weissella ceti]AIM64840.1 hypothetical protein WS105_1250 [Weissella ceti]AKZ47010.1 hypothetical protein WS08_1185a [Weissella tructae]ELA07498.1 hypothetical protein WCNC_03542 [Weissella ceti NC36]QVV91274.1 hypothetical protein KHQ32_06585 [Weissella tructae]
MWFQIIIKTFVSTIVLTRVIQHVFPQMTLHCYEEKILFSLIIFVLGWFFYLLNGKKQNLSKTEELPNRNHD